MIIMIKLFQSASTDKKYYNYVYLVALWFVKSVYISGVASIARSPYCDNNSF